MSNKDRRTNSKSSFLSPSEAEAPYLPFNALPVKNQQANAPKNQQATVPKSSSEDKRASLKNATPEKPSLRVDTGLLKSAALSAPPKKNEETRPRSVSEAQDGVGIDRQVLTPSQSYGTLHSQSSMSSHRKLEKIFGADYNKNGSSTEEELLKKVFDSNDKILSSTSCSYGNLSGKLYVTENTIYFFSPDTSQKVLISFRNITAIAIKRKGSIEVSTFFSTQYVFAGIKKDKEVFGVMDSNFKNNYLSKNYSISYAIERNDAERIRILLVPSRKAEAQERDEFQSTPLHAAVKSQNPDIVQAFLQFYKEQNLDINVKDMYGWTVMHVAANYSSGSGNEDDVLRLLLEHPGIGVDAKNHDGNTPLHYFAQTCTSPSVMEIGELLIKKHKERGSSLNVFNNLGETPLHKALFNQAVRIMLVQLLISFGSDVNVPTHAGDSVLHYAIIMGRKDLVKLLINSGANLLQKNKDKKTPYELCKPQTDYRIVEILKRAQELYDWLKELQLEEHFQKFIKEELYLDTLVDVDDHLLESTFFRVNIQLTAGAVMRVKKAMAKLRAFAHKGIGGEGKDNLKASSRQNLGASTNNPLVTEAHLIKQEELEFTKILGSGTFGTVFKGIYKSERVAIKVLNESSAAKTEFKKEYDVMSTVRSPNLVRFIGASLKPKICLVMEYCVNGSLYHVLNDIKVDLTWELGLKFAYEMMCGLNALHSYQTPIYHRDMKSLNILVTEDWTVKLTDFGLSRFDDGDNMELWEKSSELQVGVHPKCSMEFPTMTNLMFTVLELFSGKS